MLAMGFRVAPKAAKEVDFITDTIRALVEDRKANANQVDLNVLASPLRFLLL